MGRWEWSPGLKSPKEYYMPRPARPPLPNFFFVYIYIFNLFFYCLFFLLYFSFIKSFVCQDLSESKQSKKVKQGKGGLRNKNSSELDLSKA